MASNPLLTIKPFFICPMNFAANSNPVSQFSQDSVRCAIMRGKSWVILWELFRYWISHKPSMSLKLDFDRFRLDLAKEPQLCLVKTNIVDCSNCLSLISRHLWRDYMPCNQVDCLQQIKVCILRHQRYDFHLSQHRQSTRYVTVALRCV